VAQPPLAVSLWWCIPLADVNVLHTRRRQMVAQTPCAVFNVAVQLPLAVIHGVVQTNSPSQCGGATQLAAFNVVQSTRRRQYGDADTMRRRQCRGAATTRSLNVVVPTPSAVSIWRCRHSQSQCGGKIAAQPSRAVVNVVVQTPCAVVKLAVQPLAVYNMVVQTTRLRQYGGAGTMRRLHCRGAAPRSLR
jgi:hypothetical protein